MLLLADQSAYQLPGEIEDAQRHLLADQRRIDLIDHAVEAHRAVLLDLALGLEQEQLVEIEVGLGEPGSTFVTLDGVAAPRRIRSGAMPWIPVVVMSLATLLIHGARASGAYFVNIYLDTELGAPAAAATSADPAPAPGSLDAGGNACNDPRGGRS